MKSMEYKDLSLAQLDEIYHGVCIVFDLHGFKFEKVHDCTIQQAIEIVRCYASSGAINLHVFLADGIELR